MPDPHHDLLAARLATTRDERIAGLIVRAPGEATSRLLAARFAPPPAPGPRAGAA